MRRAAPGPARLAATGMAVVGVTYGMARYGYGLLLPDIRRDYGLGAAALGAIGTGAYVSYLAATVATGSWAARIGPRRTAVAAALIAAAGLTVAGLSGEAWVLALGILVAGAGSGFAFAPFSDAAKGLPDRTGARVLSAVNCATGYGVAVAAPVAILAGTAWRHAWLAFAAIALGAAAAAWLVLPSRTDAAQSTLGWRAAAEPRVRPLVISGVLVGLGSSAYWTFAVEHLTSAGGQSSSASRTFLGVVGIAGVLATLVGDLVARLGAARSLLALTAVEAVAMALIAMSPGSAAATMTSAVLFGATYSAAVGVQVLWSQALLGDRPSLGVSVVMVSSGAGLMLGALGAGVLADLVGLGAVMLVGAATVAAAAVPALVARAPARV